MGNICPSFWEAKNIRYFADTALSGAAPGHLIVLKVETPVNGDFQLWDSTTSFQCGLEVPLSWGEGSSTLVPVLSLLPDISVPIRSTRATCDTILWNLPFRFTSLYILWIIWGLEQNSYFNIQLYMLSKYKSCLFVFSFNRAFLGYQCLAKFLKVGPDIQRKWSSFITPLTDLAFFAFWILEKGKTT